MSVSSVRGVVDKATIHLTTLAALLATLLFGSSAWASGGDMPSHHGGEASLVLPDLDSVHMLGMTGKSLLMSGLLVTALGIVFGVVTLRQIRDLPAHKSMKEISDIIWETCKTYLIRRASSSCSWSVHRRHHRGLLRLSAALRGACEVAGHPALQRGRHRRQLRGGLVRHPRQHLRQLAHRLRQPGRQALPGLRHPAEGGHEHRHAADQRRADPDAGHPAVHPRRLRRPVLHRLRHRRVAGRGGAAHRRRHLHQDRRHRLRPDEDRLQDQGRRRPQPRRHRRLHRRQRRRLGRARPPTASRPTASPASP